MDMLYLGWMLRVRLPLARGDIGHQQIIDKTGPIMRVYFP